MKQALLIVIFLGFSLSPQLGRSTSVNGSKSKSDAYPEICGTKGLIDQSREKLKPDYIYDGFRLIKVKLKDKPQVKTLIFPVNSEVDFKYVFNGTTLPEGTEIRIYNSKTPSEETLKFNEEFDGDQDLLVFETTKDMWVALIEIKIPPASEEITSGCICILAGYKL